MCVRQPEEAHGNANTKRKISRWRLCRRSTCPHIHIIIPIPMHPPQPLHPFRFCSFLLFVLRRAQPFVAIHSNEADDVVSTNNLNPFVRHERPLLDPKRERGLQRGGGVVAVAVAVAVAVVGLHTPVGCLTCPEFFEVLLWFRVISSCRVAFAAARNECLSVCSFSCVDTHLRLASCTHKVNRRMHVIYIQISPM